VSGPPFSGGSGASLGHSKYRKSVLDYVKSDLGRMSQRLGAEDRIRLDAHLSAVRELERETAPGAPPAPGTALPAGTTATSACKTPELGSPNEYPARLDLMFRLATMAFACDITRVMVLQYSQALSYVKYPFLGINYEDHSVSHEDNGGTPNAFDNYSTITRWKVEQFGRLVAKLRDVKEGATSLLDNSLVLFFSECGVGTGHSAHSMPLLLAGRGGGAVRTGRHLKAAPGTSMNRLLFAMLKIAGATAPSFGVDGAEVLAGLST
jgi:hypothetical protein